MASVRLDSKNVGDTIKIKENGTARDFIVVHKGSPSSAYYGMDGGVIVLRKDIHSNGVYDSSNNDYANSDVHSWCNGTYLNTIQEDVRSQIMTVRIPYRRGTSGSSVSTGANGLSCRAFLLSTKEVDSTESYSPNEGAVFSYFKGGGNSKRVARLNGSPNYWWLRSPDTDVSNYAYIVYPSGGVSYNGYYHVTVSYGRRPAFVLPGTLYVDDSGNVVTNESPTAPGSINVSSVVGGGTTTITITAATDPDGSIANYQYQRKVDGGSWETFQTTSALSVSDSVSSDWGTVQYRACAIDNQGATGPYVESTVYDVNSGYITIGGPSKNMGEKDAPFTFSATIGVSGLSGIKNIHVKAWVDSFLKYNETKNQGDTISFEVDTRTMATGTHTIRVSAEQAEDSVLPAMEDYTFTIPMEDVPEGGRSVQAEDELGNPIWFRVMARDVISTSGASIMNDIEDLRTQHHGMTGQLEHVDTVANTTTYTLARDSGSNYAVVVYPQIANGTANPMLNFSIPSTYNGTVTLGSIGSANCQADSITFTIPNTAILSIYKYALDSNG